MKQMYIPRRLMLSGSVAAAAFVVAGLSASAQTATTAVPTTSTATAAGDLTTRSKAPKGASTSEMVQEACQRQQARTAKFLQSGVPEQWGSEEPFTFDPAKQCP